MRVHSADAYAFDFVNEGAIDELNQVLLESTQRDEPPGWGGQWMMHPGSRNIDHEQQLWGTLTGVDSGTFDTISAYVLRFPQVPEIVVPLLVGRTEQEETDGSNQKQETEGPERLIDSNSLQEELAQVWSDVFSNKMPGLLSELSANQVNIGKQPPLTLCSGQIMTSDLDEIFARPSTEASGEELVASDEFVESLREGEFCAKFGIQPHGLISLNMATEHYLMLTGQSNSATVGTQLMHDAFATIGFLSEDDPMLVDHIGWDGAMGGPFEDIPEEVREEMPEDVEPPSVARAEPLPNYRAAHNSLTMIPMLFYFYWFRSRVYQTTYFGQILRQMPVGVQEKQDVDDFIEFLQNREPEFYSQYVDFLDRVDSALSLIEALGQLSLGSPREHGGPLRPDQTPPVHRENGNLDIFDYSSGIFELLGNDITDAIDEAKSEFDDLQDRYEIVLNELNQQLDLLISKQNRDLTDKSVELQEDMKELNQSSLNLQENVNRLTWILAILTILLVIDAFGATILDLLLWLFSWASQFA
jgi:hypothetical protein